MNVLNSDINTIQISSDEATLTKYNSDCEFGNHMNNNLLARFRKTVKQNFVHKCTLNNFAILFVI